MSLLRIAFIFSLIVMMSCGNDQSASDDSATTPSTPTVQEMPQMNNPAPTPPTEEPAQNAEGVWHYICPDGCEGGSGSAGPCANCGTQLVHNTAYHGNAQQQIQNQMNVQQGGNQQIQMQQQQPPQQPEPAQNANGVWHYVCPSGCAGGSGSAGACPTCGAQLTHNSAYHQ